MAILDKALELASRQAVTASAPTANTIDAGATKDGVMGRDIGISHGLSVLITTQVAAAAAGAATVRFTIQDSPDNATFTDKASTGDIPIAQLGAGSKLNLPLPPGLRRYVRGFFTVGTGPLTAGTFSAHITDGADFSRQYPATP